jgi:HlyD family secretion protein
VFVLGADSIPVPRLVQIGLGDWDNTQIVSGLEEGETLVIVGAAQLQAQQQAFLDRMRSRMGGGSPFGGGGGGRGRR